MKHEPLTEKDIEDNGGLLVLRGRPGHCLGDLLHLEGHGLFDPTYGKVPVSLEAAKKHNAVLDAARIKGLDNNCSVGQCGTFYLRLKPVATVVTWLGTTVSRWVRVSGRTVTFWRENAAGEQMMLRGRLSNDSGGFTARRIK